MQHPPAQPKSAVIHGLPMSPWGAAQLLAGISPCRPGGTCSCTGHGASRRPSTAVAPSAGRRASRGADSRARQQHAVRAPTTAGLVLQVAEAGQGWSKDVEGEVLRVPPLQQPAHPRPPPAAAPSAATVEVGIECWWLWWWFGVGRVKHAGGVPHIMWRGGAGRGG